MKPLFTLLTACLIGGSLAAQISHGGQPFDWKNRNHSEVGFYNLPEQNIAALRAEDQQLDQFKNIPYRFGVNVPVDLDINNSGTWTYLPNGNRIWRLGINSPGSVSLNFVFDQYQLAEGGRVFVYAADGSQLMGSFTAENTSLIGSLGVGFVAGDALVIEYEEPAESIGTGYLHIDNVTHGYRTATTRINEELAKAGPFGNSGGCNINVNCPEGLPYAIQRRSVAIIVVNNNASCSGALVNNTAQDNKPYFLTANHCLPGNPTSTQNWVFYFNHEAVACNGNTGPTNQSVSGATIRASNALSDFGLLEFNDPVPPSFNPCYSGWDATDAMANVTSAYGMHHPSGDVKKICFENNAPYHVTQAGFAQEVWWIDEWELGVTEGGSSGSPLFSQSGMIIGQLAGGAAACSGTTNNGLFDFYGRFGVSWNTGATSTSRLKEWLDPLNSGQLTLPNSCSGSLPNNDVTLGAFGNDDAIFCSLVEYNQSISVFNSGSNAITSLAGTVNFNGNSQPLTWSGNIPVAGSAIINLGLFALQPNDNVLVVNIPTVNGQADPNPTGNSKTQEVNYVTDPQTVTVNINFDDYPDETAWEIRTVSGTVLYSGGPYGENELTFSQSFCLASGCYNFEIFDDFGDGLCCEYGNGSYSVVDGFGVSLAVGGEFGDFEETAFCVQTVGLSALQIQAKWEIYPNPANDQVRINLGEGLEATALHVYDLTGRIIAEERAASLSAGASTLDVSAWANGVYLIQIQTSQGPSSRKLVISH